MTRKEYFMKCNEEDEECEEVRDHLNNMSSTYLCPMSLWLTEKDPLLLQGETR